MRKYLRSFFKCFVFIFSLSTLTLSVQAVGNNGPTPQICGAIDQNVYDLVEEYKTGLYEKRANDPARKLFLELGITEEVCSDEINVDYIYSSSQLDSNAYEATRIAVYSSSLEQETQDELHAVIVFNRIVYQKKTFGDPWNYIMLDEVKGGVVENTSSLYWCEYLYLKYDVHGIAFDSVGNRIGYINNGIDYGGAVEHPTVGSTYYIDGPSDYYYNMGDHSSAVVGWTKATISRRLSGSETLEVSSAIEPV